MNEMGATAIAPRLHKAGVQDSRVRVGEGGCEWRHGRPAPVIASAAKQSSVPRVTLGCFVAALLAMTAIAPNRALKVTSSWPETAQ